MKRPRVLIADDHMLFGEAFRKLLEPMCEVVETVADGFAALKVAAATKPDIVVLDISMPLMNGLEVGRRLKRDMPATKIIYLTMNDDTDCALEATRDGVCGYILKTSAASELFHAIQTLLRGRSYVTPQIARRMEDAFIRDPTAKPLAKELTPRQREVLQLLAEGKSMKEAAEILRVTPRTIAFHKYRMMEHLGARTTADLIQFAIRVKILVI